MQTSAYCGHAPPRTPLATPLACTPRRGPPRFLTLVCVYVAGGVRRCAGRHMARPPRTAPAPTPRAAPGRPASPRGPPSPPSWASRASRSWRPSSRRAAACPAWWAPEVSRESVRLPGARSAVLGRQPECSPALRARGLSARLLSCPVPSCRCCGHRFNHAHGLPFSLISFDPARPRPIES